MTFPFEWLVQGGREVGLVVAVAVGFGFGFVLERAGFGRAQKLVAQFYGDDMTVFKVMFGAIVTAMGGAVLLSGLGLMDLRAVADVATSPTWIWPMLVGGFVLGLGFIVSGYCPGTSIVAAGSGKVDGLATVAGVVAGTLLYGELMAWPAFAAFTESGDLGHLYLQDLLHLPAPVVALAVAAMAIGCFVGAERIERLLTRGPGTPVAPRRAVLAGFAGLALAGLATLALPRATEAVAVPSRISPEALARRVVDSPWKLRVLDLRSQEACAAARVPGAECTPASSLRDLDLGYAAPGRDLVLVADGELAEPPADVRAYRGRTLVLEGGWAAWKAWALEAPEALPAGATADAREAWLFRSGVHAALTGAKAAAPPAPAPGGAAPAKRKATGGGCSG